MKHLLLSLALALGAAAAAAQPAQQTPTRTSLASEAAIEMVNHYRLGRGDGMLQAEERCWTEARASRKSPQIQALGCARLMISGGVIDQAMQISERRGPLPAFDPAVQRQRFLQRTSAMGLNAETAQQVLTRAASEIPQIVEGLSLAGLR